MRVTKIISIIWLLLQYLPITNAHAVLYTTSTDGKSNLKRRKDTLYRYMPFTYVNSYTQPVKGTTKKKYIHKRVAGPESIMLLILAPQLTLPNNCGLDKAHFLMACFHNKLCNKNHAHPQDQNKCTLN